MLETEQQGFEKWWVSCNKGGAIEFRWTGYGLARETWRAASRWAAAQWPQVTSQEKTDKEP